MTTALQQARFRARDAKTLVQVRLTPAAVAALDKLVTARKATGRAEVLEALLVAPTARDALTVVRRHLMHTGESAISATDVQGYTVEARRFR